MIKFIVRIFAKYLEFNNRTFEGFEELAKRADNAGYKYNSIEDLLKFSDTHDILDVNND